MSASNTLTRNMDDVRKKRVIEQKKRAQVSSLLVCYFTSVKEKFYCRTLVIKQSNV